MARHTDERGVATIWAACAMVLVGSVGLLGVVVAVATARQHRLDAAADLAAVSAAGSIRRGESACSAAVRVAEANGVRMAACTVEGADVVVTVEDRMQLPMGIVEHLVSMARAGPQPAMPLP